MKYKCGKDEMELRGFSRRIPCVLLSYYSAKKTLSTDYWKTADVREERVAQQSMKHGALEKTHYLCMGTVSVPFHVSIFCTVQEGVV